MAKGKARTQPAAVTGATTQQVQVSGEEATILVCQCGSTQFRAVRQTRTVVQLECEKCGAHASVKCRIASVQIDAGRVALALRERTIAPDPNVAAAVPRTEQELGYKQLRFRVGIDDQYPVIRRALEAVRVDNRADPRFDEQQWQGTALELVCADYLAGADPRVLDVVDRIDDAVEQAAAAELARRNLTRTTPRRMRQLRADARAELLDAMLDDSDPAPGPAVADAVDGVDGVDEVEEPEVQPEVKGRLRCSPREVGVDAGQLLRAVTNAIQDYDDEVVSIDDTANDTAVGTDLPPLLAIWERDGGYLFAVRGDVRTVAGRKAGKVAEAEEVALPEVYLWMAAVSESMHPAIGAYYEGEVDLPALAFEVVELVPADGADWEMPPFADRREAL